MIGNHQRDLQFIKPLACHCEANQATSVSRHEIDGFGCDLLGRDHQVAFVFTVFIVDDDDHPAFLNFVDGFFNPCEGHRA